ncbi:DUF6777 domain-containing protein [Streptomyces violaceus]|uniref:DUF6777-containing protein n=1 Tax=Streptomyces violaceus TaxID=1936 RepID=A0ABY9UKA7_STRVL|nr:DUF6777 domain-containing protein [Streptomyces janthinus]WND23290.1 DUF6777-containing protein [Streptomyces janthinus]GGS57248.1 hypothetical protein GCM10010270_30040 [Streptomyces janthinus]
MSVEPPSSGRPTGPPSGPLSGPSQPPSGGGGPPSEPPGGGGGEPPEPRRPWWGSAPRVALIAGAVVAAVVLAVVFTRPDGGTGPSDGGTRTSDGGTRTSDGEVLLQPAADTGPDPFTDSTAKESSAPSVRPTPAGSASQNAVRAVRGGAPGLYGGTRNVAGCDVEKQITYLEEAPDKQRAFASVQGIDPSEVPAYLRSLTPVQLRMDTWVTNHGYKNGRPTQYQAVLQAGTAVLVDERGVPRVRCACGNPLSPPASQQGRTTGDRWAGYKASDVVTVRPAQEPVDVFVMCEPDGEWFERDKGDTGKNDRRTSPPDKPTPSVTVTTPTGSPSSQRTTSEPTATETSSEPGESPPPDESPPPPGNDTGEDTGGDTTDQAPAS